MSERDSSLVEDVPVQLAAVLRERLAIVADESSRRDVGQHMERLKQVSERIDALRKRLPKPMDPQLAHFLERCSYEKALELLEASQPTRQEVSASTTQRSTAR
jgi:predicted HAD superfamily Cof-like phosphohydrolase